LNKIKIIVDSTVDISVEFAEKLDVLIYPLKVNFGQSEEYRDIIDIDAKLLYQKVKEKNMLPHTAAVSMGEYYSLFGKWLEEGYDIIYTGIGSGFSSSHNNACMVAKDLGEDRIEVVDSGNLSTGIALLVLKACKFRDQGLDVHEVANKMRELVPYVRSQFVVDTMEYLHKGGRCSGMAKIFGTILKIHPLIAVRDKKMVVAHKPRGKMVVGLDKLLEMLDEDKGHVDLDHIFVTHSEGDEYAKYLLPKVKERYPDVDVIESRAGSIVSTHCGPGTIGILWIYKD